MTSTLPQHSGTPGTSSPWWHWGAQPSLQTQWRNSPKIVVGSAVGFPGGAGKGMEGWALLVLGWEVAGDRSEVAPGKAGVGVKSPKQPGTPQPGAGRSLHTPRIFLSLWVLGWEDRRFRISSPAQRSLPEGRHTFPKPFPKP